MNSIHGPESRRKKICIFVDGDYWHANPIKYKPDDILGKTKKGRLRIAKNIWERDKRVTRFLMNGNHIVLRFWERDIKQNVQKCINEIKRVYFQRTASTSQKASNPTPNRPTPSIFPRLWTRLFNSFTGVNWIPWHMADSETRVNPILWPKITMELGSGSGIFGNSGRTPLSLILLNISGIWGSPCRRHVRNNFGFPTQGDGRERPRLGRPSPVL